ncbi:L-lactate permease [Nonomuraea sp. NPDC049141]|uniref:L-lactate permease n=1 Tax=Nonomuraea sp. NPDC049141 TaxID=3155500 RepID=UPI0033F1C60D
MYQQIFDPVLGQLGLSALVAAIPLLVLFVLLGVFRWKAQWAGLSALAVAALIAVAVYGMPIAQTLSAGGYGAASSFLTVIWILVNALWIFKLTESTGHFGVLRRSFAGAGTPVAISAVMLIALGLPPFRAAVASLVANTAPVAFGALSVPITTLSKVTGLDFEALGAIAGRQTSVVATIVPLVLVFLVDGRRGVRAVWPAAVVAGLAFGAGQFIFSNYISVELADIGAALSCAIFLVAFLRVWRPREPLTVAAVPVVAGGSGTGSVEEEAALLERAGQDSRKNVILAYLPYAVVGLPRQ